MATITAVRSVVSPSATVGNVGDKTSAATGQSIESFFWETLTETNADGSPIQVGQNVVDIVFHVIGSDGTGGTLKLQGSNDGTNWASLTDSTGTVAEGLVADSLTSLAFIPLQVRPYVEGGTTVDYDVYAIVRYV